MASPESTLEPYRHQALSRERREIRLVEILNLEMVQEYLSENRETSDLLIRQHFDTNPIQCKLHRASLDDYPHYIAVSYMWGDRSDNAKIVVSDNGVPKEISITRNLHEVLKNLTCFPNGQFWIDAICINQADNEEKAWQIEQMYSIYESATYVFAWLASLHDHDSQLFHIIRDIGSTCWDEMEQQLLEGHALARPTASTIKMMLDRLFPKMEAFKELLDHPYWRRAWIQQELEAGKDAWLHCQSGRCELRHLYGVMASLSEASSSLQLSQRERWLFSSISPTQFSQGFSVAMWALHPEQTMLEMLEAYHLSFGGFLRASEPRDLIYALIGLASDQAELGITPDYACSYTDFCRMTAESILQHDVSLLLFVNLAGPEERRADLPTWAPDWSAPFQGSITRPGRCYSAAADSEARLHFEDRSSSTTARSVLVARGVVLDHVLEVEQEFPFSQELLDLEADSDLETTARDFARDAWTLLAVEQADAMSGIVKSAYPTTKARRQAVWATATMGCRLRTSGEFQRTRDTWQHAYTLAGLKSDVTGLASLSIASDSRQAGRIRAAAWFKQGRNFFVTKRGALGLGTRFAKRGDVVFVALGLSVPIILRPVKDGYFQMVGHAYVHGIMDGELFKGTPPPTQDIRIV